MISYALALHMAIKCPLTRSEAEDEVSSFSELHKQAGFEVLVLSGDQVQGKLVFTSNTYCLEPVQV